VRRRPFLQQTDERRIADGSAQRAQHERAPLINAIVEHERRSRVTDDDVVPLGRDSSVMLAGEGIRRWTAVALRPDPLGVAGETLVEPDVFPVREADAVAEPLVGEFVGDEAV